MNWYSDSLRMKCLDLKLAGHSDRVASKSLGYDSNGFCVWRAANKELITLGLPKWTAAIKQYGDEASLAEEVNARRGISFHPVVTSQLKPYDDSDAALSRTRKTVTANALRVLSDKERKRAEYIEKDLAVACIKYAESKNLTAVPADKDGWPDYQFLLDADHASFWSEFKAPKGRTTEQQDARILTLRSLGFTARVVNSLTDFKKIVDSWLANQVK